MDSDEHDEVDRWLMVIKYTYEAIEIDDPTMPNEKIPLKNIQELTQVWRDTMKEVFSSTVDLDEETMNDNFKIFNKVMEEHLGMYMIIEGDYAITKSIDGRTISLSELLKKDLWFCKKLEEK